MNPKPGYFRQVKTPLPAGRKHPRQDFPGMRGRLSSLSFWIWASRLARPSPRAVGAGDESVNSRFSVASQLLRPSFQMPAHLVYPAKRAAGKPGMGVTWPTANSRQMPSVDFAPELFQRLLGSSKGVLPTPAVIPPRHPRIPISGLGALGTLSQEVVIPIGITAGAPFPMMGLYSHWAFPGFYFIPAAPSHRRRVG